MTRKPNGTATSEPATARPAKLPSKSTLVLNLLTRNRGATAAELGEPTGWQPHSVRAYLSGLRKQGRTVIREQRKTGETVYRIVVAAGPAASATAEPAAVSGEAPTDAEPAAAISTTPAAA